MLFDEVEVIAAGVEPEDRHLVATGVDSGLAGEGYQIEVLGKERLPHLFADIFVLPPQLCHKPPAELFRISLAEVFGCWFEVVADRGRNWHVHVFQRGRPRRLLPPVFVTERFKVEENRVRKGFCENCQFLRGSLKSYSHFEACFAKLFGSFSCVLEEFFHRFIVNGFVAWLG